MSGLGAGMDKQTRETLQGIDTARKDLVALVSSPGWELLEQLLEQKAQTCDDNVTRFIRPDANRTVEQIVTDNNELVTTANALRYPAGLVRLILKMYENGE